MVASCSHAGCLPLLFEQSPTVLFTANHPYCGCLNRILSRSPCLLGQIRGIAARNIDKAAPGPKHCPRFRYVHSRLSSSHSSEGPRTSQTLHIVQLTARTLSQGPTLREGHPHLLCAKSQTERGPLVPGSKTETDVPKTIQRRSTVPKPRPAFHSKRPTGMPAYSWPPLLEKRSAADSSSGPTRLPTALALCWIPLLAAANTAGGELSTLDGTRASSNLSERVAPGAYVFQYIVPSGAPAVAAAP